LHRAALNPPPEFVELPYTSQSEKPSHTWVSLLLRPMVSPEVTGGREQQTYEPHFFAPGNLVSNLDFVESEMPAIR
jgi:hypothetical protein